MFHLTAHLGFKDAPDVPVILAIANMTVLDGRIDVSNAVYFLSSVTVVHTSRTGMRKWRKRLFIAMARNAGNPVEYFNLPPDRAITVGSAVEI